MSTADHYSVVVVGGGPAGLATSAELRRRGVEHVVLERGDTVGYSWANLYDSMTLHTGKHLSHLPRMAFGRHVPLFPSRRDFVEYLQRYVEVLELPVETHRNVTGIERHDDETPHESAPRRVRSRRPRRPRDRRRAGVIDGAKTVGAYGVCRMLCPSRA